MLFFIYLLVVLSAGLIIMALLNSPEFAAARLTLPGAEQKVKQELFK